jgi:hypothetical protein
MTVIIFSSPCMNVTLQKNKCEIICITWVHTSIRVNLSCSEEKKSVISTLEINPPVRKTHIENQKNGGKNICLLRSNFFYFFVADLKVSYYCSVIVFLCPLPESTVLNNSAVSHDIRNSCVIYFKQRAGGKHYGCCVLKGGGYGHVRRLLQFPRWSKCYRFQARNI